MVKNYLKITFRNLLRNKIFSFINITGLAIGLASCFTIMLYIWHEMSYDRFHKNADRIYRIVSKNKSTGNIHAGAPYFLAPLIKDSFTEISQIARIKKDELLIGSREDFFRESEFIYADANLFDIFDLSLLKGDPRTALADPYSIVITKQMAQKYFGHEEPMGQILTIRKSKPRLYDLKVTGVLKDFPANSHFKADFIAPLAGVYWGYENIDRKKAVPSFESWDYASFYTYILLTKNGSQQAIATQLKTFNDNLSGFEASPALPANGYNYSFWLQPLKDIHLYSAGFLQDIDTQGYIKEIYLFATIAFIILLIAIINYVLLSTARSLEKSKEIGLRKVIGAQRSNIITQIMGESVMISLLALPVALVIVEYSLPAFEHLFGTRLEMNGLENLHMLGSFLLLTMVASLISGSYIALRFSRLNPIDVIKNKMNAGPAKTTFRRALIVFQLAVFIVLVVSVLVVFRQINFAKNNKVLGFEKERVLSIHINNRSFRQKYTAFKTEILRNAYIEHVSASQAAPPANASIYLGIVKRTNPKTGKSSLWMHSSADFAPNKQTGEVMEVFESINVDSDYIAALGLELVAGRSFSDEFSTDKNAVIVNEAYVKERSLVDPVDKEIPFANEKRTIIGVVKDFHTRSMYEKVSPLVMSYKPRYMRQIIVKIAPGSQATALAFLKKKWLEFNPDSPFEYSFLDETINRLYGEEQILGKIIGYFALLAIFIACLGLFGVAHFTAEQRTKEIGIRKVMGASVSAIMRLVSREFILLVILANVLAWPVAWLVMNEWLKDFAYKINVGFEYFMLAGSLALVITMVTIAYHTAKAASTNPARVLKYE